MWPYGDRVATFLTACDEGLSRRYFIISYSVFRYGCVLDALAHHDTPLGNRSKSKRLIYSCLLAYLLAYTPVSEHIMTPSTIPQGTRFNTWKSYRRD